MFKFEIGEKQVYVLLISQEMAKCE